MDHIIPAIFDAGVFRPLVPVDLAEGLRVELGLTLPSSEAHPAESQKAWQAFLDRVESTPDEGPQDGFSNRDHDRLLYGE